jgi:ribosomal protein S18 acetylase RimI-like enzyme
MWVSPDARGTGAGAALVRWVVGEVVGERRCRLELGVVSGNLAALGLYRRLGFVAIGSEIGGHSGSLLIRMRYDSALDTAGASGCR